MEEEYQLMYLASEIVEGTFKYFKIEQKPSNVGNPSFDLKDMIKLILKNYQKMKLKNLEKQQKFMNEKCSKLNNFCQHSS